MMIPIKVVGDGYETLSSFTYYSKRYNESLTIPKGFYSDGATDAIDINSDSWLVHDYICRYGVWDSGKLISNFVASTVLSDILGSEGYSIRRYTWWISTFLFGGGQARKNGLFYAS